MNKRKTAFSLLLILAVSTAGIPAYADYNSDSNVIAHLNFDSGSLDNSYCNAEAVGNILYQDSDNGKCAVLSSNGYIKLSGSSGNDLLAGKNNLTISMRIKQNTADTSWWFFAAPDDSTQKYKYENYFGLMGSGSKLTAERYKNNGARSETISSSFSTGEWTDVVLSISEAKTDMYINGKFVSSASSDYTLSEILSDDPVAYIGKANWPGGEYADGCIDYFTIYNYSIPEIDLGDTSNVSSDLILPEGDGTNISISWSSSDETVITSDGKINKTAENTEHAILTADITLKGSGINDIKLKKTFNITVPGKAYAAETFSAHIENGKAVFSSGYNPDSGLNMFTALYNNSGKLINVAANSASGEFAIDEYGDYEIACYLWDNMEPVCDTIKKTITYSEKEQVTEYKYSFVDDVIQSSGSASQGSVYEWAVTSVPQYFYVDTIDFDAVESISIRSGYESGSAVTSVYAFDNGGDSVTVSELSKFCTDNSPLGEPVGYAADQKSSTWGYRTAVLSADSVTSADDSSSAFTMLDSSKPLDIPNGTGKRALIIGLTGNIGSKAYFEYVTVKYKYPVDKPTVPPFVESVSGEGIKTNSVISDKGNKELTIPVIPGTDLSALSPEITLNTKSAEYKLTDGTWSDGKLTITSEDGTEDIWTVKAVEWGNPVLDGFYADPNIAYFNDTFYIYPTTDGGSGWNSTYFKAFSSKDLVHWKDEGIIFDLSNASWSSGVYGWAPTITEKNGKYYFYFSGCDKNSDAKHLGVAVSDSPTGPFIDKGEPLVNKNTVGLDGQMIDPAVFTDDDGQSYLYWGNGQMYVAKLSDDMMSIDGEIKKITPSNFREAAFVIKRNGIYYFMWSDKDTGEPTYEVHYGTSSSPFGPINGDTIILSRNKTEDPRIKATGHNSVVNVPGTDDWYICYHRFNIPLYGNVGSKNSEAGNHREVCIDKLEFDENGAIIPVTATLKGVDPVNTDQ